MGFLDTALPNQSSPDAFLDAMRTAAQADCLLSAHYSPADRTLRDARGALAPGWDAAGLPALLRRMGARVATHLAARPEPADDGDLPVWLPVDDGLMGIGQRVGGLYPVVACQGLKDHAASDPRALLALTLAHVAQILANSAQTRSALAEVALRMLSIGYFVVDAQGRIRQDGRDADGRNDAVWLTTHDRLALHDDTAHQALMTAIRAAASDRRATSIVPVPVGAGQVRLAVVTPLPQVVENLALVLLQSRQADDRALRDQFLRAYALTRSERLIAREILLGRSPEEIANEVSLSVATVRSYLKQVLAKTGTHRQTELITLYHAATLPVDLRFARMPQAPCG